MKKEKFIKIMKDWKSFQEDVEGVHDSMKKLDPDFGGFFLGRVSTLIGEMLTEVFADKSDWIGYYVYELDWGKGYKPGCIKSNGKNVKLKTLDDLWSILHEKV